MSIILGRRALYSLAGGLALAAARPGAAQSLRPIRLIVPYGPGSGPDMFARNLASGMQQRLGNPVVVENRGGASTIIGTDHAAGSPADGSVLLMGSSTTFAANPHLYGKLPYKTSDFQPITMLVRTRLALYASPSFEAKDMREVIARAKASAEPLHFGITGRGNSTHLTGEALKIAAGIDLQDVPYSSVASMQQGLMSGDLPLAIDGIPAYLPIIRDGRVKVIAVTGDKRVGALPETPTFAEAGVKDTGHQHWYGLLAPKGLPAPEQARLHKAAIETMQDAELWKNLTFEGATVETNTPERFAALMAEETEAWGAIIRRVGLRIE
ncbi:Bug family tripartite tricarboxylate transporter substrate binding protein [Pseudoroseomonas ludipueritiae]|uniref:Tripartite tricarboxylate transporter substrate binding protein n=1 Tax=Pseudoroseomonas ludipueritiae TaxID=198093 RepID=A0ABR7R6U6_9PROT|nr:tripartite tricarboxylate transporter substrate binding protein [Pseudoroseomonas ludipueritiae]MBC9177419.1 tripartite tricarboxylate transporter substrate binding protein [Pseudoroseomonas ludipueritiae]MCG7361495.1 tripartite tricarboxylate transporter substrate binding protein [Roseomonas sp. ACRSG]